jgi:hypothetical protein
MGAQRYNGGAQVGIDEAGGLVAGNMLRGRSMLNVVWDNGYIPTDLG